MSARRAAALIVIVAVMAAIGAVLFLRGRHTEPSARLESIPAARVPQKARVSFEEAKPILERLHNKLPPELAAKTARELETGWSDWVMRHDAEIRGRLERGDEDSLVNFWLYGTTFTARPRATQHDLAGLGPAASVEEILLGRLDDLVASLASPGANERLQFARRTLERKGIDVTTAAGQDLARRHLIDARERVLAENERYQRTAQSARRLSDPAAKLAAYAGLFRDRGLSSDTSLTADFAVDGALETLESRRKLEAGRVRAVAIVGPGLDFTDKAQGYDFYPQQTIQPFAVVDSLIRTGAASRDGLRVVTFDLSPRVNQHLEMARRRARDGGAYVLQLPLARDDPSRQWMPELVKYWQRIGGEIGTEVEAIAPPSGVEGVRVRAVRVDLAVVLSIAPQDVNIVVERMDEQFDLIVATNILVYYDAFDQALALANIARMLRPGGFFLTNYALAPAPPMESVPALTTTVEFDRQHNGDTMFFYRRR